MTLDERGAALAAALDSGEGRLPVDLVADARGVLQRAHERAGLSSEHTVVALAGATGSGKSSLLNALAGADLARTGVQRPTTAHALAAVWGAGAGPLLDWLDVPDRHDMGAGAARSRRRSGGSTAASGLPTGLVLLDLPDHDSVVDEHRVRAERLVQRADLLVWVVDPQKYADAALHTRYLRPAAGHDAVTVVALNQVDRLDVAATRALLEDVQRLVAADGMPDARVLGVSARTGQGVDELRALLAQAAARRRAATDRWAADERAAAARVLAALGPPVRLRAGSSDRLVRAFEQAAGVDAVTDAVRRAAVRRAAAHTGWPPLRWLARLRPDPLRRLHLAPGGADGVTGDALVERTSLPPAGPVATARASLAVRDHVEEALRGAPEPWQLAARRAATADGLADDLDLAVAGTRLLPARPAVWWRVVGGLQWMLLAAALAGLAWLGALWLLDYLRLPEPRTAQWGSLPAPTWLAAGGVLAGWLVAALGGLVGRLGARRRAAGARRRLSAAVAQVAQRRVVTPVADELAALDACRRQATRAAA